MRLLAVFASLVLFVGFAVAAEKYESKDGNYSVAFPETPKLSTKKVGNAEIKIALLETKDNNYYVVVYTDVSAEAVKDVELSKILEGGEKTFVSNLKAKVTKSEELNLKSGEKKYLAREFYANKTLSTADPIQKTKETKIYFRARVFVVDNRLYQVFLTGTNEFVSGRESDQFFNSFELKSSSKKD